MMKKILIVFGTRPEAIKMAPLALELKKYSKQFKTIICVTAQHREMLDQVLDFFDLTPDYDLNLMQQKQTLTSLTAAILIGLKPIIEKVQPNIILVHGDTTTSTATALAGFYAGIPVGHIEAGLRTWNKYAPFPEEINRRITAQIADFHFAPTPQAASNLLKENIPSNQIWITGNTVIDALQLSVKKVTTQQYRNPEINLLEHTIPLDTDIILVTGHRRENFGDGMTHIFKALKQIAQTFNHIHIVYPVHLNPNVQGPANEYLGGISNITLLPPLGYPAFVWLMDKAKLIITDSGGIQEEAPSLGKPVLVTRDTTERPEAIEAGTVVLVGTDKQKIVEHITKLLTDQNAYLQMSQRHNPYGDGNACEKIIKTLFDVLHLHI